MTIRLSNWHYGNFKASTPPHPPPAPGAARKCENASLAKTKARRQAGFREPRQTGLMFGGRNRSNGLTTTKPVCVLSVDSLGSEVKKKNRALKIPYNPLI